MNFFFGKKKHFIASFSWKSDQSHYLDRDITAKTSIESRTASINTIRKDVASYDPFSLEQIQCTDTALNYYMWSSTKQNCDWINKLPIICIKIHSNVQVHYLPKSADPDVITNVSFSEVCCNYFIKGYPLHCVYTSFRDRYFTYQVIQLSQKNK